jgi:hypothetical protein
MNPTPPPDSPRSAPTAFYCEAAAFVLVGVWILYAGTLAVLLSPPLKRLDACSLFLAGAVPGLLVTLLFWFLRPEKFDRRRCRTLIGISLSGAAAAALSPLLVLGS